MMTLESIEDVTNEEGFSSAKLDRIAEHFDPPSQALTEMVRRVANELELDVCSLYVLETDRQSLCLAATMGSNQTSVGHVRMKISEGLAGFVAEQLQSVSVAAASEHPRFKYFPEAGEESTAAFMGWLSSTMVSSREFSSCRRSKLVSTRCLKLSASATLPGRSRRRSLVAD